MRIDGSLKTWNDERGFGFIEAANGGPEIFVHIKAFEARSGRPTLGQPLSFEVESGRDGRKQAVRVRPQHPVRPLPRRSNSPSQWGTASYFAIPAFFLFFVAVSVIWQVPQWVGAVYLVASALCYFRYRQDKAAATAGNRRVPESTLIALGLLGGWPGAIIAQQTLRHKSSKAAFRSAFWASVVVNVLGFTALATPLRSLLPA